MSFICPECRGIQPHGAKPVQIVYAQRRREYTLSDGRVTVGREIVAEAQVCTDCAVKNPGEIYVVG